MTAPPGTSSDLEATRRIAEYFCRLADTINLPRSVALIYHTLFLADEPLSFGEIVERSGLSKASASTGLKLLERMHGVEIVVRPDDRRTFYRPELSLRRLATGFLEQNLQPGLRDGSRLLEEIGHSADDGQLSSHLRERIASLRRWHELAGDLLPLLSALSPR